jgi:hypothetical protein
MYTENVTKFFNMEVYDMPQRIKIPFLALIGLLLSFLLGVLFSISPAERAAILDPLLDLPTILWSFGAAAVWTVLYVLWIERDRRQLRRTMLKDPK